MACKLQDYLYLITPNIWPLNRKYKGYKAPFYGLNDEVPILLTIILGLQHALCMVGSIVSPPLAIAGGAFYFDSATTQYLVSAAFITTGLATAMQVTRVHISKTPFYIGTGLLSVVGPTFDILPIAFTYTDMRYNNGTCPTAADGTKLPCPEAWGAILGSILCTVWVQIAMSLSHQSCSIKSSQRSLWEVCYYSSAYAWWEMEWTIGAAVATATTVLVSMLYAPIHQPLGHYHGLGFTVFLVIVLVELFGSPLMKSASVIIGLFVGCLMSGLGGYWSMTNVNAAPAATFLWVHTFPLSVDGALILPLLIMFICEAVSCMPDILATSEISGVEIQGTEFNSRVQGGILCDGVGSLVSALGTGPPMVSQAGNNGVIVITGCASRRAGWCASAFLLLMGIFGKFGAIFGAMPPSVLGGMQVFLYSSIAVAGLRVLGMVRYTRRNRFILTVALGIGFLDVTRSDWWDSILTYSGSNVALSGFEQGLNLIVQTPFIIAAVLGVVLNLILPEDASQMDSMAGVEHSRLSLPHHSHD
ncbi:hypothetical protein PFICI_08482 [Pestalotiopsis fici W106-1]|uniref:Purine permease n=1 Tax=Pestalotiopsis fici (strain W106-1 / CGMCC3.15140) TaxID=1229662 RepID=W3X486_PESFW|nr:uncharacterized protein PFICI_08482 [Pestalotiopsis fici W106-1]ETS80953.1 hypothetical protein PFICI_08482 [Pestalotiopsis fici W106-1]